MLQNKGLRHFYSRRNKIKKEDGLVKIFDKIIYVAVFLGPIMNFPQLYKIWYYQDAGGVSFISWISFSIFSLIWLIYGILHKNKAIIITDFLLLIIQVAIAVGAFLYS